MTAPESEAAKPHLGPSGSGAETQQVPIEPSGKHYALLVEIPAIYTDDIEALREFKGDSSESEFLLNIIGQPGIVRLRCEVSGEKDGTVEEVWGFVREARLVDASVGYEPGGVLTDEQLAEHGGHKLLRDEHACEWCMTDTEALDDD